MSRSDSATSMSIADALALSPTNRLTSAERKAFCKSDHKAGKVLGITLTRNHVGQENQNAKLALVPSPDEENAQGDDTLGKTMALIDAKCSHNRNTSTVTIIRSLKDLGRGLVSGMGMDLVGKRNKKRKVAGEHAQRVVLGSLRSNESSSREGNEELSNTASDDSTYSFLELDEDEETPLAYEFLEGNDEEGDDDRFGSVTGGFVWVDNPFATPPSTALQRYLEARWLSETIGPLNASPVASLCYTTNCEASSEEESPALFSGDSFNDMLHPAERAYLDFLITQDEAEAEEQPMERRRDRRAALRSRNKMLDVLGAEARQAVDEQC
ncbi:hypothetical protein DFH29DRAFT_1008211 [Suillus ampliporus]|nr:hypothetical protein DFH29DRAFT_1008211 [Suillus ampliporus]